jgi:hypothetical protein
MGGLGLLDLKVFGRALRFRWLWFARADQSRIWASLPSNDDSILMAFFRASTFHEISNGTDILFWKDAWVEGSSIGELAPELVAAVPARKQKRRSLASALVGDAWISDITGALTVLVLAQYLHIRSRIHGRQVHPSTPDKIVWGWTISGICSSCSAYRMLLQGQCSILGAKKLLETKASGKCRFFAWQVLHWKIWTSEWLLCHGLPNSGPCILCAQEDETVDHLLLTCVYSREVWFKVLRRCGWQRLAPSMHD